MLYKYKNTFSLRDEIGTCPNIEVEIDVTDKSPFFIRPWINKEETLLCMYYSPTPCRTLRYLEQSVSGLPHQKPSQNWMQGLVHEPFYTIVILHIQYSHDIMIMTSWSSVFFFRWEISWCMCSRVMLTHLCICRCPWTYPMHSTWHAKLNFIPPFLWLWHSPPGKLVCPHTGACNLLKQYKCNNTL